MIKEENLKSVWKDVCESYVKAFCKRHHFTYEPNMWVGMSEENIGTFTEVCDMFVSLDDIRYDVDTNQHEENFMKWYYKSLGLHELGVENYMNYPSFCKGAPDIWNEDKIKELQKSRDRLEKAQNEFYELIDKYSHDGVTNLTGFSFADNKNKYTSTDTYTKSEDTDDDNKNM